MSHKQMLFRAEAREKILRGAAALSDAVRVTLGPKSKSASLLTDAAFTARPAAKPKALPGGESGLE